MDNSQSSSRLLQNAGIKHWCTSHGKQPPMPKLKNATHKVMQKWFFLIFGDSGGGVEGLELAAALQSSQMPTGEDAVSEMLDLMDVCLDASISREEFLFFFITEWGKGKNFLPGNYLSPSGQVLPIGAMVSRLTRDRMMQDIMKGGAVRRRWMKLLDDHATQNALDSVASVDEPELQAEVSHARQLVRRATMVFMDGSKSRSRMDFLPAALGLDDSHALDQVDEHGGSDSEDTPRINDVATHVDLAGSPELAGGLPADVAASSPSSGEDLHVGSLLSLAADQGRPSSLPLETCRAGGGSVVEGAAAASSSYAAPSQSTSSHDTTWEASMPHSAVVADGGSLTEDAAALQLTTSESSLPRVQTTESVQYRSGNGNLAAFGGPSDAVDGWLPPDPPAVVAGLLPAFQALPTFQERPDTAAYCLLLAQARVDSMDVLSLPALPHGAGHALGAAGLAHSAGAPMTRSGGLSSTAERAGTQGKNKGPLDGVAYWEVQAAVMVQERLSRAMRSPGGHAASPRQSAAAPVSPGLRGPGRERRPPRLSYELPSLRHSADAVMRHYSPPLGFAPGQGLLSPGATARSLEAGGTPSFPSRHGYTPLQSGGTPEAPSSVSAPRVTRPAPLAHAHSCDPPARGGGSCNMTPSSSTPRASAAAASLPLPLLSPPVVRVAPPGSAPCQVVRSGPLHHHQQRVKLRSVTSSTDLYNDFCARPLVVEPIIRSSNGGPLSGAGVHTGWVEAHLAAPLPEHIALTRAWGPSGGTDGRDRGDRGAHLAAAREALKYYGMPQNCVEQRVVQEGTAVPIRSLPLMDGGPGSRGGGQQRGRPGGTHRP